MLTPSPARAKLIQTGRHTEVARISILIMLGLLSFSAILCFVSIVSLSKSVRNAACVAVAIAFTTATLFLTQDTAGTRDSIKSLQFGWPLPFLTQNQERLEPPLPRKMMFAWDLSTNTPGYPANRLDWYRFVGSVAMNYALFIVLRQLLNRLRLRIFPSPG